MKRYFSAGLFTLLPLVITVYVFYLAFSALDNLLGPLFEAIFDIRVPGIGFAAGLVIIFLVGVLTSHLIGRKILSIGHIIFTRLPLARTIYTSAKQIIDAFTIQGKHAFERVVMLQYPRKGLFVLGFVTGTSRGEIQERTRKEVLNIFIPTTPNPTSGMLFLAPHSEVIDLEMTVEEGMKIIISGGLVSPLGKRELQAGT